jgi:cyclohexyl-isocyanide hydratase
VLSHIPNSTYRVFGKSIAPVRDVRGLRLTPDADLDEELLGWVRKQAAGAKLVFSVCTGALVCGAAGLLKGRRATTHWASFHLLPYFGAIRVNERVVVDGEMVFAAGVTAGIDGALRVAAELRGDEAAQTPALHGVRAGTALQQRDAGDRTGRHSGTGPGFC